MKAATWTFFGAIMTFFAIVIFGILFASAGCNSAHAQQTNLATSQNQTVTPEGGQPSPAALKIADDVRDIVIQIFSMCSGMTAGSAGLGLYLFLKFLRTRTQLGANPKIAPWLNVLNIEAKGDNAQPITPPDPQPAASAAQPEKPNP